MFTSNNLLCMHSWLMCVYGTSESSKIQEIPCVIVITLLYIFHKQIFIDKTCLDEMTSQELVWVASILLCPSVSLLKKQKRTSWELH